MHLTTRVRNLSMGHWCHQLCGTSTGIEVMGTREEALEQGGGSRFLALVSYLSYGWNSCSLLLRSFWPPSSSHFLFLPSSLSPLLHLLLLPLPDPPPHTLTHSLIHLHTQSLSMPLPLPLFPPFPLPLPLQVLLPLPLLLLPFPLIASVPLLAFIFPHPSICLPPLHFLSLMTACISQREPHQHGYTDILQTRGRTKHVFILGGFKVRNTLASWIIYLATVFALRHFPSRRQRKCAFWAALLRPCFLRSLLWFLFSCFMLWPSSSYLFCWFIFIIF